MSATPAPASDLMMLTILFQHDQSKTTGDIRKQVAGQGYFEAFPPAGVRVVSWYAAMGLGQLVTLEFPASRLRDVNRSVESTAWGGFRTQMYATYDFYPVALEQRGLTA